MPYESEITIDNPGSVIRELRKEDEAIWIHFYFHLPVG
jgi:hypothetical protein